MVKLLCNILKVLSRGSRVILEEGILEVGIFRIVSDLVFMMYFVHDFNGGGMADGIIGIWITVKFI